MNYLHTLYAYYRPKSSMQSGSIVFGDVAGLESIINQQPSLRIALYPCISQSVDGVMGIWSLFRSVLASIENTRVYNVFVDPETVGTDTISNQFSVAKVDTKMLNANLVITGQLDIESSDFVLKVELYGALLGTEKKSIIKTAKTVGELILQFPDLVYEVANLSATNITKKTFTNFTTTNDIDTNILSQIAEWDILLVSNISEITWSESIVIQQATSLINIANQLEDSNLLKWAIYRIVSGIFMPFYNLSKSVINDLAQLFLKSENADANSVLVDSLFKMGYPNDAIKVLKDYLEKHPDETDELLQLARLQTITYRFVEALETYQKILLKESTATLLTSYGDTLLIAEQHESSPITYIFAEGATIYQEAVEAYTRSLTLEPKVEVRAKLLELLHNSNLYTQDSEEFWEEFDILATENADSEYLQELIADMQEDEAEIALQRLDQLIAENPKMGQIIAAVKLAIIMEDYDAAQDYFAKTEGLPSEQKIKTDLELLALEIQDPHYAFKMTEIEEILIANKRPSDAQIDYLEGVVEIAPHFANAYVLLARCYKKRQDIEVVMEVLMDAHEKCPDSVQVLLSLGNAFWESDETDLAVEYLLKGLEIDPQNISILVQMARYMFDSEEFDTSKAYLERAESLDETNQELIRAKIYIGNQLSN
jgi:tetratricopeptide (TPR) repeat protein